MKSADEYGPALEGGAQDEEVKIHGRKFGKKGKRHSKRKGRRKGRR